MEKAVAGEADTVIINPLTAAKKLRQRYKENDAGLFLSRILKNYYAVVEDHLFHEEINAFCFKHKGIILIGINRNRSLGEKNFIIAHELGHYILSHPKTISINLKRDHCLSRNHFSAMDMQANSFALELLMPEDRFKRYASSDPDIDELARQFSVSHESVLFRIKSLNLGCTPEGLPPSMKACRS